MFQAVFASIVAKFLPHIDTIFSTQQSFSEKLEDVIDVMLNLKGLAIKTDSKEPQNLRIDVDKPGPVLASDIQLPAGVKVLW